MDKLSVMCYGFEHETHRQCSATGKAAVDRSEAAGGRSQLSRCRQEGEFLDKLFGPLDASLSAGRTKAVGPQADAGPSTGSVPPAKKSFAAANPKGSDGRWLCERDVDSAASGRADSTALRRDLSSGPCLEGSDRFELELPKTRTPRHTTRRQEDCALETRGLAQYKKTRHDVGLIWFSSTKAASWSSPPCGGLGRFAARHPSIGTATNGIGFRRSRRLRCRLFENGLACVFNSSPKILLAWR